MDKCVECFRSTPNDNRLCDKCQEIVSNMYDYFSPKKEEDGKC